jgi:hypothetical protein
MPRPPEPASRFDPTLRSEGQGEPMPTELKAVEHVIEILFDTAHLATDPFTYRVDDDKPSPSFKITVGANVAVFRFFLTTTGDPLVQGVLGTSPIQWLSSAGTPTTLPSSFFSQRTDDLNMILMNLNEVAEPGELVSFNFEIAVVYQGRTYTSPDPTIINVQPPPTTPTDEPKAWQETPERPASALIS